MKYAIADWLANRCYRLWRFYPRWLKVWLWLNADLRD